MTKTKIQIEKIEFVREIDSDAESDYLGKYQSQPGDEDVTIDRKERGDMGRNEFQFFVAAMSAEETGNPESVEQDYQRAEALNSGQWSFVYVYARATVTIGGIRQELRSGGIGGIESDSGREYFEELKMEQLAELRGILTDLGIGRRRVAAALADCVDAD